MLLIKTFTTSLLVKKSIEFCANKQMFALEAIREIFEKKCFKGCYIVSIIGINKISNNYVVSGNLTADTEVDVEFTANIIIYGKGEVLTGVKIEKKEGLIVGLYDKNDSNAIVVARPKDGTEVVNVGQTIPIRILQFGYPPFESAISIIGTLFVCDRVNLIFQVNDKIQAKTREEINILSKMINDEYETRSSFDKETADNARYFEELLYSYRGCEKKINKTKVNKSCSVDIGFVPFPNKVKSIKCLNIFDIIDNLESYQNKYIYRDLSIIRSSPYISIAETISDFDTFTSPIIIKENINIIICQLLRNIYDFLKSINEMAVLYDDNLKKENENIFFAMEKMKLVY